MTTAELIYSLRYCFEKRKTVVGVPWYVWCDRAADALEAADKRIAELEAQMPKEGEWLRTDAFPHRIYCSVCYKTYVPNDRWQIWVDGDIPKKFCPNCGARMMKGEEK